MTQPRAFTSSQPSLIGIGIEALLQESRRLGLVQVYRPGTVQVTPTDLMNVSVILDGDEFPIRAQSLVGGVPADTRVMIMTVPPQGVYIIGFVGVGGIVAVQPIREYITDTATTSYDGIDGAVYYDIECVGGGGAGGGATAAAGGQNSKGSGGGGGGYARSRIAASDITFPVSVTVGSGGTGVSGAAGGSGVTTVWDSAVVSADGGVGGSTAASSLAAGFSVQGGGGGGATGDFVVPGGGGSIGTGSATLCGSGSGGDSHYGNGANGRASAAAAASLAGFTGGNYGGGGSGAAVNAGGGAQAGGNGGPGIIIVTGYFH